MRTDVDVDAGRVAVITSGKQGERQDTHRVWGTLARPNVPASRLEKAWLFQTIKQVRGSEE